MTTGPIIAEVAALVGDPARATIVSAPMLEGTRIPPVDVETLPDDLRERLKVGFHDLPQEQKLWRKFTTSGSSGLKPKVSYYTKDDWEVLVATGARLLASHVPFGAVTRVLNCFNGGHVGAKFQEDSISTYGCSVEGVHMTRTTPEAVLEQLMKHLHVRGMTSTHHAPAAAPALARGGYRSQDSNERCQ